MKSRILARVPAGVSETLDKLAEQQRRLSLTEIAVVLGAHVSPEMIRIGHDHRGREVELTVHNPAPMGDYASGPFGHLGVCIVRIEP